MVMTTSSISFPLSHSVVLFSFNKVITHATNSTGCFVLFTAVELERQRFHSSSEDVIEIPKGK
jgi:hypothetical protein